MTVKSDAGVHVQAVQADMVVTAAVAVAAGRFEVADALLGAAASGEAVSGGRLVLLVAVGRSLSEVGGGGELSRTQVFGLAVRARQWCPPGWQGLTAGVIADVAESAYVRSTPVPDVTSRVIMRAAVLLLGSLVADAGEDVEQGVRRRIEAAQERLVVAREAFTLAGGDQDRALEILRSAHESDAPTPG